MKKTSKIFVASLFLTAFALSAVSFKEKPLVKARADGEWTITNTKALAYQCDAYKNGIDAYFYFTLSVNDYTTMAEADHLVTLNAPNFHANDYNFLTHIEISNDNETYVPFSNIYNPSHINYFFKNGTFRFGLKHNQSSTEEENTSVAKYKYVKVLEGCEFPSYDYCVNGGEKKKFVQEATTISKGVSEARSAYVRSNYSEYFEKPVVNFKQINIYGWNNIEYPNDSNYRQLILDFDTDFLANSHTAETTNRAAEGYDIGQHLTINGLPIYKIREYYNKTKVGYDHGNNYLYVVYPADVLLMNKNNMVPTLHIDNKTEFMDVRLSEVTIKFVSDRWIVDNSSEFKVDNPVDLNDYLFGEVTLPHKVGDTGHPIFNPMPAGGAQIAFSVNTGNIDLSNGANAFHLSGLYKSLVAVFPSSGVIQLLDMDDNNKMVQQFSGFAFAKETDYTFEFEIVCSSNSTTFKAAINHLMVLNYTYGVKKSPSHLYVVDTSNELTIDVYKELQQYNTSVINGGPSTYDFMEGDPVYNFAGVIDVFNIYDKNITFMDLEFIYDEGAVTDNKYNAGNWTLTVKLEADGYQTITKTISINVHGHVSMVEVYFDDGDPIEVAVGSKLTAPTNPATYTVGEIDYIFEGWYLGSYKWDFENDVVESSMHLTSKYIETPHRYTVTVNYEGIDRNTDTYYLSKNKELPFDLFELDGALFEVKLNDVVISSLTVTVDVTITVVYTILYSYVEAKEATCTEDGNVAYWYTPVYPNCYFADSSGNELIEDAIIHHTGHKMVHLEYKDSTCSEIGNVDCYYCENCHKHFADENGEVELENWFIPKKPHELTHHDRVEATCEQDGNVEYWTCENEPGVYYGDAEATIVLDTIVIPATGHDYQNPTYTWKQVGDNYECTATLTCTHCHEEYSETKTATKLVIKEATCTEEGQVSYSVKFDDIRFSAQTKIVSIPTKPHTYVFFEQVDPTPEKDGVKEHYECSECHKYFVKEGDVYIEVQYGELIIKYVAPSSKNGCGGNIATASLLLFISAGALLVLLGLKRKEEK